MDVEAAGRAGAPNPRLRAVRDVNKIRDSKDRHQSRLGLAHTVAQVSGFRTLSQPIVGVHHRVQLHPVMNNHTRHTVPAVTNWLGEDHGF